MDLKELFGENKICLSLEIFPPKRSQGGIDAIYQTLDGLKEVRPGFISCTYGAGGNLADNSTCDICSIIKDKYHIPPIAHLTCLNNSKADMDLILSRLKSAGVNNILALRGDRRPEVEPRHDFSYACELISYIKEKEPGFFISAACYPEGHPESDDLEQDIDHLKHKVDCGAEHLISQLFFNNDDFYAFRDKCAAKGINVPIEAGIMPVTSKSGILRMVSMCGASIPSRLAKLLNRFEDNPKALADACIAYAINQIIDLIANDVDGIHLYTMNKPDVAARIFSAVDAMR